VKIYIDKAHWHFDQFFSTGSWLRHRDPSLPEILVNRDRCPKLISSIQGAPAKTTNGKTEKDKALENTTRYPTIDQTETTHFSDTFDMVNHAVLQLKRIRSNPGRGASSMRSTSA
jgi:hypothetical protein